MKILAIADRPPQRSILETVAEERPEIIITLGDLDFFSLRDLEQIHDIPKIGVYGNHCSGKYMGPLGIENMHLETKEVGGILFGGFEGSIRYKTTPEALMYTDEEATRLLKNFPRVDVMIAHSPPKGLHDEDDPAHFGIEALRTYIEEHHPKYFLHGHTYVSASTLESMLGETKVVHVFADQVLDLAI